MAKRKTYEADKEIISEAPDTLEDCLFYGMTLDEEQKIFRDAIWSKDKDVVFCDAKAGTGKTTIAVGVGSLLVKYGRYKGLVYIISPTQEQKQGYIPGDIEAKSAPYMEPLYEALVKIGEEPSSVIMNSENIMGMKNGTAYVECMPHTYLRGCNFENKVVILDESQNYFFDELKKVLTRMHDSCKVIVIGHTGQIDLYKNPNKSGFAPYLASVAEKERAQTCTLSVNHRGWISQWADSVELE